LGADAIPAILELTHSPESESRWWALRTLAQSPLLQTEWLIPFLDDPAPEVRQCAALGLGSKPDEGAIQPLVGALSDRDGMVCNLALNALITIGKAAVPSLIEVARSAPQSRRIHALRALAEIRDHAPSRHDAGDGRRLCLAAILGKGRSGRLRTRYGVLETGVKK
jgi:HEAT repeat protein